jgi:hypothetical protein
MINVTVMIIAYVVNGALHKTDPRKNIFFTPPQKKNRTNKNVVFVAAVVEPAGRSCLPGMMPTHRSTQNVTLAFCLELDRQVRRSKI